MTRARLFKENAAPTNSMGTSSTVHGTGAIDTYDKPSLFGGRRKKEWDDKDYIEAVKRRATKRGVKRFRKKLREAYGGAGSPGSSYVSSQTIDAIKGPIVRTKRSVKRIRNKLGEAAPANDNGERHYLSFSRGKFKIEKVLPPEKRVKLGGSTPLIINPNMHDTMNKVGDPANDNDVKARKARKSEVVKENQERKERLCELSRRALTSYLAKATIDADSYMKAETLRRRFGFNTKEIARMRDKRVAGAVKAARKLGTMKEHLGKNASRKAFIDDFIKSKNAKFSGDSKNQRIRRALGAYYHNKGEVKEGLATVVASGIGAYLGTKLRTAIVGNKQQPRLKTPLGLSRQADKPSRYNPSTGPWGSRLQDPAHVTGPKVAQCSTEFQQNTQQPRLKRNKSATTGSSDSSTSSSSLPPNQSFERMSSAKFNDLVRRNPNLKISGK